MKKKITKTKVGAETVHIKNKTKQNEMPIMPVPQSAQAKAQITSRQALSPHLLLSAGPWPWPQENFEGVFDRTVS